MFERVPLPVLHIVHGWVCYVIPKDITQGFWLPLFTPLPSLHGLVCFAGHSCINPVEYALCALWTCQRSPGKESTAFRIMNPPNRLATWWAGPCPHPQGPLMPGWLCGVSEGQGMAVAYCAVTTSAQWIQMTVLNGYKLQFQSLYSSERRIPHNVVSCS